MHKDFGQKRSRNRMIRGTTCRYVATCDTSQSKRNTLLVLLAKMWHERGFSARELCGAGLLQKSFAATQGDPVSRWRLLSCLASDSASGY